MNVFKSSYRDAKIEWDAIVTKSGQEVLKNVMNMIILWQRILSFHPDEWGELADYQGLRDKLLMENKKKIVELAKELDTSILGMENILRKFKDALERIDKCDLDSKGKERLDSYLGQLLDAYTKELELRKTIVEDLKSSKYLEAEYEVIVTLTAIWTGKCYTNQRAIGHLEQILDIELSQ